MEVTTRRCETTVSRRSSGVGTTVESGLKQEISTHVSVVAPSLAVKEEPLTTRLIISKMVLTNFKSYAGRVEIGPFHKSFSSVIGPNGSGKSNVIDSLLFVFGFRAKKLRQGKLSDLIHKSDGHDARSCSVEVHFLEIYEGSSAPENTPGHDYAIVPNSSVVISRIVEVVNGSDKSTYMINGKTSTYTELSGFLMSKGIDLTHERFLILQGEVESIALMKPKAQNEHEDGLLEYLEDLIGTNKYKPTIESFSRELEDVNRVHDENTTVLKFKEREKNSLRPKYNEAISYLKLENDLVKKRSIVLQDEILKYDRKIATQNEAFLSLDEVLKKHMDSKKDLVQSAANKRIIADSEIASLKGLVNELQKKKSALQKMEMQRVELQEKAEHGSKRLKKLEDALKKDVSSLEENTSWMDDFESSVLNAEKEQAELQEVLDKEEEVLDSMRKDLSSLTEPIQRKLEELQSAVAPFKEKISKLESERAVLESNIKIFDEREEQLQQNLTSARTHLEANEKALEESKQAKETVSLELSEQLSALEKEKAAADDAKRRLGETRSRNDQIRRKLDEAKFSAHTSKNFKASVGAIMKQRDSGRINGICGRLGDLAFINPKYDVAITTACSSLDSIVVETVDSAQRCIEFLRQNNLGRATFICLEKMKPFGPQQRSVETPGKAPRLIDLIRPKEERFMPAFYYALKDTLVANDLKEANEIAYGRKRWRVVTLKGQVIDTSGAMSGGGSRPQSGGMLRLSSAMKEQLINGQSGLSASEIQELETDLAALNKTLDDTQNELYGLEASCKEKQKLIQKLENSMKRIDMELKSFDTLVKEGKDELKRLLGEVSSNTDIRQSFDTLTTMNAADVKKRADLELQVNECNSSLEATRTEMEVITAEIEQKKDEILQIGGSKLKKQQSEVEKVKKTLSDVHGKIKKFHAEKSTRQKTINKLRQHISSKEKELESLRGELDNTSDETGFDSRVLDELKSKIEVLQNDIRKKEETIKVVKDELEVLDDKLHHNKQRIAECEEELKSAKAHLESTQHHKKRTEDNLAMLELHEIVEVEDSVSPKVTAVEDGNETEVYEEEPDSKEDLKVSTPRRKARVSTVGRRKSSRAAAKKGRRRMVEYSDSDSLRSDGDEEDGSDSSAERTDEDVQESEPIEEDSGSEQDGSSGTEMDVCSDDDREKEGSEDTLKVCGKLGQLKRYSVKELSRVDISSTKQEISRLEEKINKSSPNLDAIEEYRAKVAEFRVQFNAVSEISEQREEVKRKLNEVSHKRFSEFMEGFNIISQKLKEMYQMITIGGNAELELVDSLDPFSEGIVFSVMPPKKSWKNIANLSGGEKTLSSLALVFALHHYRPTPLYVMDEIDAALDFRNVSIVANYIKERTKNAQFIIISLRNNMFELADRLVGIYKTDNKTKSVTLNPHDAGLQSASAM